VENKSRIMIVEDDLDLSEMLDTYFRVQNYDVRTAAWGEEALKISREEDIDLIVLDIRLPDISGYDVCRQLRLQRRTQDVPIIFLTEKRDRVDKLQGLELGVVDYITKPFDIQELRLRVRNALSRVERQTLVNPVTDLPESQLAEEKLSNLLYSENAWAVLVISINGLSEFRDVYGFVAADEVLRAVTLMVRNAVREFGSEGDFIGHLSPEEFVIITGAEKVNSVRERVETRVRQSREYFYPPKARETKEVDQLNMTSRLLDRSAGPFNTLEDLKAKLMSVPAR